MRFLCKVVQTRASTGEDGLMVDLHNFFSYNFASGAWYGDIAFCFLRLLGNYCKILLFFLYLLVQPCLEAKDHI